MTHNAQYAPLHDAEQIDSGIHDACIIPHTYLHAYIPAFIHTYLHTDVVRCLHTCLLTCMPTYICTHLHAYICAHMHAYIHMYVRTYVRTYVHPHTLECSWLSSPLIPCGSSLLMRRRFVGVDQLHIQGVHTSELPTKHLNYQDKASE